MGNSLLVYKMRNYFIRDRRIKSIEERSYGRKKFTQILPTAHCKTREGVFKAPVYDISSGGAFIKTSRRFIIGQEIAMKIIFPATMETHLVTGEIARISSNGAGVKFKILYK